MKKIYIGQLLPKKAHLPILYPNLGAIDRPSRLFFNYASAFSEKFFELCADPAHADFLMIPHDYFYISSDRSYVDSFVALAKKHSKTILIFDHSDLDLDIDVDIQYSIVFRVARYRHQLKPNEIIMPPIIEDLGAQGIFIRPKGPKPVVGFCGYAGFKTLKDRAKYALRCALYAAKSLWDPHAPAHMPGLYFRRASMQELKKSGAIETDFIVRSTYSGHKDSIELDPAEARGQYIANMAGSDFALCPKGDGNYSNRFYEALSLGRIPVLIDTECVLPFEDEIDYGRLIVRVPYGNIDTAAQKILERYDSLDDGAYAALQRDVRNIWTSKLSATSFFRRIFDGGISS